MKYKTIPGVILTSVCGRYYLVTARETMEINETAAICWEKLTQGASEAELAAFVREYCEVADTDSPDEDIRVLIATLQERNLLTRAHS